MTIALKALAAEIAPVVRDVVQREYASLLSELHLLRARVAELEEREQGVSEERAAELAALAAQQAVYALELPVPEPVDVAPIEAAMTEKLKAEAKATREALTGLVPTAAQIGDQVKAVVAEAVAALPVPADGKDGVGMAGALLNRSGNLVVTMTDGKTHDLGPVVGRDADMEELRRRIDDAIAAIPTPRDGRDAMDLETLEFDIGEDGRTLLVRVMAGDQVIERSVVLPIPVYRDVWKEGETYVRGDIVTFGGQSWHCTSECKDSRPSVGPEWRLFVRKGRDAGTPAKL